MAYKCGSYSIVGLRDDGGRIAVPLRCRQWTCPSCGPVQKRQLLKRCRSLPINRFLTLTANPARSNTPADAFNLMSAALPSLIKRIRRLVAPREVRYLAVWELTRAGWPHLHILLQSPYLPQAWLSNSWSNLTGAPIVDIRTVRKHRYALNYLAKYLTKQAEQPIPCRRFRASTHWLEPRPPPILRDLYGLLELLISPVTTDYLADIWQWQRLHVHTDKRQVLIASRSPPAEQSNT